MIGCIVVLAMSLTSCATTPEMAMDCPKHYTDAKEITKCEKRVEMREKRMFEREQVERAKAVCSATGGVWMQQGQGPRMSAACVDRDTAYQIMRGLGHGGGLQRY